MRPLSHEFFCAPSAAKKARLGANEPCSPVQAGQTCPAAFVRLMMFGSVRGDAHAHFCGDEGDQLFQNGIHHLIGDCDQPVGRNGTTNTGTDLDPLTGWWIATIFSFFRVVQCCAGLQLNCRPVRATADVPGCHETACTTAGPVEGALAFLNVQLGSATLIVEFHHLGFFFILVTMKPNFGNNSPGGHSILARHGALCPRSPLYTGIPCRSV